MGLSTHVKTPSLLKIQKLAGHGGVYLWSQLLGRLRQENHSNPRQRLQWAEIAPLHSSLGNKSETPSQKKRRRRKKKTTTLNITFAGPPILPCGNFSLFKKWLMAMHFKVKYDAVSGEHWRSTFCLLLMNPSYFSCCCWNTKYWVVLFRNVIAHAFFGNFSTLKRKSIFYDLFLSM